MIQPWQRIVRANANILPIKYLSHVTHDNEAGNIDFHTLKKVGKAPGRYGGSPVGETFVVTDYNPSTKQFLLILLCFLVIFHGRELAASTVMKTELGRQFR